MPGIGAMAVAGATGVPLVTLCPDDDHTQWTVPPGRMLTLVGLKVNVPPGSGRLRGVRGRLKHSGGVVAEAGGH